MACGRGVHARVAMFRPHKAAHCRFPDRKIGLDPARNRFVRRQSRVEVILRGQVHPDEGRGLVSQREDDVKEPAQARRTEFTHEARANVFGQEDALLHVVSILAPVLHRPSRIAHERAWARSTALQELLHFPCVLMFGQKDCGIIC